MGLTLYQRYLKEVQTWDWDAIYDHFRTHDNTYDNRYMLGDIFPANAKFNKSKVSKSKAHKQAKARYTEFLKAVEDVCQERGVAFNDHGYKNIPSLSPMLREGCPPFSINAGDGDVMTPVNLSEYDRVDLMILDVVKNEILPAITSDGNTLEIIDQSGKVLHSVTRSDDDNADEETAPPPDREVYQHDMFGQKTLVHSYLTQKQLF